ncbi:META domain-containing protein [Tsukamurella asaccharolytica]|nr:META domain-containing protein [Tsukamurella asaccharolytica]
MTVRGARFAAALVVGAGVVASAPAASAAPVPLAGTQWRFESSGVARTAPVKYTGSPAHVSIDGKRSGGGNDGCNVFGMTAEVIGDRATFSGLFSTLRMCSAPNAGEQFRRAFDGARTVKVVGNQLTISDGPRGYWNFVASRPARP